MYRGVFFAVVPVLLAIGCCPRERASALPTRNGASQEAAPVATSSAPPTCTAGEPDRSRPVWPLRALVDAPTSHDGETIRADGVLATPFEGTALFDSLEHRRSGLGGGAVWLGLSRRLYASVANCDGQRVIVTGVVRMADHGHGGGYDFGLDVIGIEPVAQP